MNAHGTKFLSLRNDILKLLYATMLHELPIDTVKEFWRKFPMAVDGQKLNLVQQLAHIWDEKKTTDFRYVASVFNTVESFLLSQDVDVTAFVDRFIIGLNKGVVVGAPALLQYLAPFLGFLYRTEDLRSFGINTFAPVVLENIMPSAYYQVVKHQQHNGEKTSVLALSPDKSFSSSSPYYDPGLFLARPLQLAPLRIGLPPFEDVSVVADRNSIKNVLTDAKVVDRGDEVYLNGEHFGRRTSFAEFCDKNGLSFVGTTPPNTRVVEMLKPFFCPHRKREVLYKGCIYGAPLYLLKLKYLSNVKPTSEQFVAPIINDSLSDSADGEWKRVERLHKALYQGLSDKVSFSFYSADTSLAANGVRIARHAPALILRCILKQYLETGRAEFSNCEFANTMGNDGAGLTENISLRIQRVSDILAEKLPGISLKKTGRGKFKLVSKYDFVLDEK